MVDVFVWPCFVRRACRLTVVGRWLSSLATSAGSFSKSPFLLYERQRRQMEILFIGAGTQTMNKQKLLFFV